MTEHILSKLSAPGWEVKVGSELEGKELMYQHVCKMCLQELAYHIDHGDVTLPEYEEYFDEYGYLKSTFQYRMAELHEVSIYDLLGTPCGCEFWFGEEDTMEDCYESIQEELERE